MKKLINSPIFYYSNGYFTGDNVAHYLPAKYLWHVCNVTKQGFYQPVYDFRLEDEVAIDLMFYPEQPQDKYFKKPKWINEFLLAKDTKAASQIAKQYDYFINNYRYRGAKPPEMNWGYPSGTPVLELYVPAFTYKAIYEHDIYLDDLELTEKYSQFLAELKRKINPQNKPVIAIHHRGDDPWERHLDNSIDRFEGFLANLLEIYPDHHFVLLGESWRYYQHPRITYLNNYINRRQLLKVLGEYSACLQYILSAYFCRDVEIVFIGISGFTLFIESIRPKNLMPPIPIFWGPQTFTGIDTCIASLKGWQCPEFEKYKNEHPQEGAFQHYVHHFIYYCRDEEILKSYCFDYPNNTDKILNVIDKLEQKYGRQLGKRNIKMASSKKVRDLSKLTKLQELQQFRVNLQWQCDSLWQKMCSFIKWRYIWLAKNIFGSEVRP
ncbi:MAG: hypothetical protein KKA31_05985 [Candidatus Margulisbacteria bacterium]|nr:hypothetical protein [Candidatus Margulisiibacteriota bacterium]